MADVRNTIRQLSIVCWNVQTKQGIVAHGIFRPEVKLWFSGISTPPNIYKAILIITSPPMIIAVTAGLMNPEQLERV